MNASETSSIATKQDTEQNDLPSSSLLTFQSFTGERQIKEEETQYSLCRRSHSLSVRCMPQGKGPCANDVCNPLSVTNPLDLLPVRFWVSPPSADVICAWPHKTRQSVDNRNTGLTDGRNRRHVYARWPGHLAGKYLPN